MSVYTAEFFTETCMAHTGFLESKEPVGMEKIKWHYTSSICDDLLSTVPMFKALKLPCSTVAQGSTTDSAMFPAWLYQMPAQWQTTIIFYLCSKAEVEFRSKIPHYKRWGRERP